jgi:hypothetical protein
MYDIGRLGTLLVAEEATFGVTPALSAAMGMRHLEWSPTYNQQNRENSNEKKPTPGRKARFQRATTAGGTLKAYLRPSGVVGTIPESHLVLKHGFGGAIVGTLNSTVASAASATVLTLQAGDGADITVGEFVAVRRAANSNIPEVRMVTAVATDTITVSPALGGTPAAADTVKAGVTYRLTNDLAKSLSVVQYLTNLTRVTKGFVANEVGVSFDMNQEVTLEIKGPAATQGTPAASPGFTTVGAQNPPSGLVGGLVINGTPYQFMKADVQIQNSYELLRNYGSAIAESMVRNNFRDITFKLDARVNEDLSVYTLAENATQFELCLQTGHTEGNIVGVYAPAAEINGTPDLSDSDPGVLTYSFAGVLLESAATGNDELAIGLL